MQEFLGGFCRDIGCLSGTFWRVVCTVRCCWIACREEKIKRAMRQQKHASAASETASDRSRTDRDSSEVKPGLFALPLAAAPERGILKKGSSLGSIGGIASPRPSKPTTGDCQEALSATDDAEHRQRLLSPTAAAAAVSDAVDSGGFEFIDDVDDYGSCSCSCDEDEPSVADVADDAKPLETAGCSGGAGGCSVETQTDPESLTSSLTSVCDPGEKMTRLCNINELLRQIDEQFNSVLRSASMTLPNAPADLSPANSDDVRGSETEADRACPRFFSRTLDDDGSDAARDEGSGQVVKPTVRPVVRPMPLVPRGLSPETTTARVGPATVQAPMLVPCRGSTSGPASTSSADSRLLSHPAVPGTSSSPATVASEGYHSDRIPTAEPELPVIIREIPKSSTTPVQYLSECGIRPSSKRLNSPDDVDV